MKNNDFHWLVGILEGEGCFDNMRGYYPRITIQMTDVDIVQRVAKILGRGSIGKVSIAKTRHHRSPLKALYSFSVHGERASEWMRELRPWMGRRRTNRINGILDAWQLFNRGRSQRVRTTKLTPLDVLEIRRLYGTQKVSHRLLAKMFCVSRSNAFSIIKRGTWRYI